MPWPLLLAKEEDAVQIVFLDEQHAGLNQALEEAFFEDDQDEYLLFWRNKSAVVCGQFQNIYQEVDVLKAEAEGVELVRRISGGGTVYHDLGNLNYSIIKKWPKNEVDFNPFLSPVIESLHELGFNASAIANAGIGVSDQKISGSAQRIVKGRILHHGTLLYDCDLTRLRSLANGAREFYQSSGTSSVPWPVTNLKGLGGLESLDMMSFTQAIMERLAHHFQAKEGPIPNDIQKRAKELLETKYQQFDWTFAKGPKFTFSRPCDPGKTGFEKLTYEAKRGKISSLKWWPQDDCLQEALVGCPLEVNELKKRLKGFGKEELLPIFF